MSKYDNQIFKKEILKTVYYNFFHKPQFPRSFSNRNLLLLLLLLWGKRVLLLLLLLPWGKRV
jgi:hypothetical protein